MQAKDLTQDVPRSPFDEIDGLPWLGRLIDKVRSKQAGTLGEYVPYPCGADQRFLKTMGLEADKDALEQFILSGASDPEIAAWVRSHATEDASKAARDLRQAMLAPIAPERKHILDEMLAKLRQERPDLDLSGIDSTYKLIVREEGHHLPPA